MKIQNVVIEGLFGLYEYNLNFMDKNPAFIYGKNGDGKTTILHLVKSIFDIDLLFIDKTPFKRVEIIADNGNKFGVEKNDVFSSCFSKEMLYEMRAMRRINRAFPFKYFINEKEYPIKLNDDLLFQLSPHIHRGYDWGEIEFDTVSNDLLSSILTSSDMQRLSNEIERVMGDCKKISFIEANRLMKRENLNKRNNKVIETVSVYRDDLEEKINDVKKEFGEKSVEIDKNIPKKILDIFANSENEDKKITKKHMELIVSKLNDLSNQRGKLAKVGLITNIGEKFLFNNGDITITNMNAVNFILLYLDETKKKLDVFDDIYEKLFLFTSIINDNNIYADKSITINENGEMIFISKNKREIPLELLSSGEKNNLILLYDLIFNVEKNSIILIDEPEISLHVIWQENFTEALIKICKLNNLQAIVATHSPNITNEYFDNMVELNNGSK